ncbi:glucosaminidase domain-containing protein [Halioxenophilus aromaticivorans]|uniref:Glucosaminidase domain-containing protein n=1 Tax=Halioxenophilus aromaticivorans TaxID=1306992 RepID=A0AAV3U247_9ALTE
MPRAPFLTALALLLPAGLLAAVFGLEHNARQPSPPSLLERPAAPKPGPAPDFASIEDVSEKKQAFVDYLLPLIRYHNDLLRWQRGQLQQIQNRREKGQKLSSEQQSLLEQLQQTFESQEVSDLLAKVDTIPASLVLAQAATESGWGSSRFAREGNNYFGQWCYQVGCGIKPAQRATGKSHEVKRFNSVTSSVRAYFNNLNTNPAYQQLRQLRQQTRDSGQRLTGVLMAAGLAKYSEKGDDYIDYLRSMINSNGWGKLDASAQQLADASE